MSWRNDYLQALQARDRREQANKDVFDAYTRLADRTAQPGKSKQLPEKSGPEEKISRGPKTASPAPSVSISNIRTDLVEAQTQRTELQTKLDKSTDELTRLRARSKQDEQRIRELTSERTMLASRLRDRDSELREKAKLLSDVQGDAVTLNLELNAEIERNDKLVAENKDLVDRWMTRMGQEAEKMNLDSKFT